MVTLGAGAGIASPRSSHDDEAKLLQKIGHEENPVKKAKLETRLGRLKLQQAFSAYDKGNFKLCWKLLDDYFARMNSAWEDLVASGHVAARKSDGFKQLDIALRESRRDLEDFETHLTFDERQAAEKIRAKTEELHNRVLNALFPLKPPVRRKGSLAGKGAPESEPGEGPK
jgi:hypothetical protein